MADTTQDIARRLREKRAAREAQAAAPAAEPVESAPPTPAPVARKPATTPAAPATETKEVAKPQTPQAAKPQKAQEPPKTKTLDEKAAEQEAAYRTSPTGQEATRKRLEEQLGAGRMSVADLKRDRVERTAPLPGVTEEVRLQREGLQEVSGALGNMAGQGVNVARIVAGDKAQAALHDPRVVGAAAKTAVLAPVREVVKQEVADAERDFATASENARKAEERRTDAERVNAPPGDIEAARALAEAIRGETATKKDGKGPSLAKQYVDRRVTELENRWHVEREKDPAAVAAARKRAQEQALAELVRLNTEGYAFPIGNDLLFESDSPWTVLLPKREVLQSGKVARGESLPGWFFNVALGVPDYAVSTIAEAINEQKTPTLEDLQKNVADRRDILQYTIEQDPTLQADIASGDPRRVSHALAALSPYAVLSLMTPDAGTLAGGVGKIAELPGTAAKAARVAQEAARLVRVEKKLSPILALERAMVSVEKAEEAAKAVKAAAKAAAKSRKELGAVATAVENGRALENLPEAVAVRIRDDMAARLAAQPEVQAFLDETGAAGRPLTDAAREKFPEQVAEAERLAREDFVKQARLAPDEVVDATRVVDGAADAKRRAELAAEEARLQKTRATAEELRAAPGERAVRDAAEAGLKAAEETARRVTREMAQVADGTHPLLQDLRKATEEAAKVLEEDPPFKPSRALERERVLIERAQENLDATTMTDAARAKKQAAIERRMISYLHDRSVEEYLHTERLGERAAAREQALQKVRTAREAAREGIERLELEQERAAQAASEAAEAYGRLGDKGRAPNPKRLAALEAQVTKREGRIAGMQEVPTTELFGARTFDDLVGEIAFINASITKARTMSPPNLKWRVRRFGANLLDDIVSYLHPARELEYRSIRDSLWRPVLLDFEGEIKGINERLADAFASVKVSASEWNAGAREVLEDHAAPFRESIRGGGVDGAYLGSAATAYLRDPALLDKNSLRLLTDVVVQWARDGAGDLDVLRANLLKQTATMKFPTRSMQEGDVMLANAVASQGAGHRLLVIAGARGLTLGADEARAANSYLDNLNGLGEVGGRAEASRGRQVMADLLVPTEYRRPLGAGSDAKDVKTPFVAARTEQPRLGRTPKAARQEQALREAAVEAMAAAMENTEETLGKNVFVPRAVRDALAKQVDAVIATARIQDDGGGTLLLRNFWKQAAVLGVLTSQPNQTVMDFWSDVLAVNARLGPIAATKVAGRSFIAQFLATRGVAQGTRLLDVLRGEKAGTTARDLVQRLSFTPAIDAIFNRDPAARIGAHSALEVHDIFRREGVFESFSSGQLTRTVQESAYLVFGDTTLGKAKAALASNQRALQDLANLSATRRRLAIGYGLVETGHTPEEAARIAVEIAGDFSGELHPVERGWFSVVFPFWAYRRFNARRTFKSLFNPFWLTRGMKAQEGAAAALSWYLDDSDEYGFHTESMYDEPDPEALDGLRAKVHAEHPELDMASAEAEALVAERADELPRAIVRYEAQVAKLRAMPYEEAKKYADTAPEWRWFAPYHAPDPVRGMVPAWAQDRYAVFVQENRNQAVESWYRKGVGRTERDGKEQRFWLLPNDPHIDGLAELMGIAAIGSVAAAAVADPEIDFTTYNRSTLLDGMLRDPLMNTAGLIGLGDFTADERQHGKVVPDWLGEILERRGLAVLNTEQDRGEDVTADPTTKRGAKYVIPPTVLNASSLVPLIAPALLGSMEVAITGARITGDPGKPGPQDDVDQAAAVGEGLFGQKLQTYTPATEDYFARKAGKERTERAVEALGNQQPLRPDDLTLLTRPIREALASPTFQQEVRLARAKAAANQTPTSQDIGALRAYLVSQGRPEDEVAYLPATKVVALATATE